MKNKKTVIRVIAGIMFLCAVTLSACILCNMGAGALDWQYWAIMSGAFGAYICGYILGRTK